MFSAPRRFDVLVVALTFFLALFAERIALLAFLESETLGYRHLVRHSINDPDTTDLHPDILLVTMDEEFYRVYDKFPLTRTDLARLIENINRMGASVIGIDMILDFNSAYGEDPALESALTAAEDIVLAELADFTGGSFNGIQPPIPAFASNSLQGYTNIQSDSIVRESVTSLMVERTAAEQGYWPFSVQLVASHLGVEPALSENVLTLGDRHRVRLNADSAFFLDFPRQQLLGDNLLPLYQAAGLSALDLLFADAGELDDLRSLVQGRIVLVGETAELALDTHQTPLGRMYGIEIIAIELSSLLKAGPIVAAGVGAGLAGYAFLALVVLGASTLSNPVPRYATAGAGLLLFVLVVFLAFALGGLVMPFVYPVFAAVIAFGSVNFQHYLQERENRRMIRQTFSQFLAPAVVDDLEKNPDKIKLGGEERELSVLFSDLASFSSFSEKLSPTELVTFLNEYLTAMSDIIIANHGTIDKYEGDAILCFWGAPIAQENHASLVCKTAIEMQASLAALRAEWQGRGFPALYQRIGINSGEMIVGNMGSDQRMDYTVMGDAVNIGARIEGVNKVYGSDILITGETVAQLGEGFSYRELDSIVVVGRKAATVIYELRWRDDQDPAVIAEQDKCYREGLGAYRQGDFAAAMTAFRRCTELSGEDKPAQAMLKRCESYSQQPPDNWDGVTRLDSK